MKQTLKSKAQLMAEVRALRNHMAAYRAGAGGQSKVAGQGESHSLRSFFLEFPAPALVTDSGGEVLGLNHAAEEILGGSARASNGDSLSGCVKGPARTAIREAQCVVQEATIDARDGRRIPCEVHAWPDRDPSGRVVGALCVLLDLTDEHAVRRTAQTAELALRERVKELRCLYGITQVVMRCGDDIPKLMQGVADLLPESWLYPEIARGRIVFEGSEYVTDDFRESADRLAAEIVVAGEPCGRVEVFYVEPRPTLHEGPFLREERDLIDGIADHLAWNVERIWARRQVLSEQAALESKNAALREVLSSVEQEKKRVGQSVVRNVEAVVQPLVDSLRQQVPARAQPIVDLLERSLVEISSPFADQLTRRFQRLTPTEVRICTMIRSGRTSKEIARACHISPATVRKHRENIRRKLDLTGRGANLATYLQSFTTHA